MVIPFTVLINGLTRSLIVCFLVPPHIFVTKDLLLTTTQEGLSGGCAGMTIGPIPSTFNFLIFSHHQAMFS